ncbi:hypothetical protein QEH52_13155 [Coraliomargarita sp. SDUM461003]|uniref:PEP-CTERM protein-sorting domain-containing protein n=1 Tax=Thalassobacterium maritimum TaxID=3041265 RepID=A0ABU1AWE9_9BACT|nr:hypothetical protein [Coraliomargarita sp. SDUM461003]MDQ8208465.1 hypothetical protein [Coraliomargarita sp. SDUM461003]
MNLKCLYLPLTVLSSVVALDASTLFTDNFDDRTVIGSGTTTSGWAVSTADRVYVSSVEASSGANSLFMRHSGSRSAALSSFVAISDVSQDLIFSFDYFGVNSLESSDDFAFEIDFGSGYQSVLVDSGMPNGYESTDLSSSYTGTEIGLASDAGTSAGFVNYSIVVPSSYYNGVLAADEFKLRFLFKSSNDGENAYIDNVSVVAVPEPSQCAVVLGVSGLLLAVRRRRS